MDGVDYAVVIAMEETSTGTYPVITIDSATQFTITGTESGSRKVHFTVFGNLA